MASERTMVVFGLAWTMAIASCTSSSDSPQAKCDSACGSLPGICDSIFRCPEYTGPRPAECPATVEEDCREICAGNNDAGRTELAQEIDEIGEAVAEQCGVDMPDGGTGGTGGSNGFTPMPGSSCEAFCDGPCRHFGGSTQIPECDCSSGLDDDQCGTEASAMLECSSRETPTGTECDVPSSGACDDEFDAWRSCTDAF